MTDQRTPPEGGDDPTLEQPTVPDPAVPDPPVPDPTIPDPSGPDATADQDATLVQPSVPPPPSGTVDPTMVQPATPGGPPSTTPPAAPPPGDTPWWRRGWAILLWILLGALLAFALSRLFAGDDEPTTSTTGVPGTTAVASTTSGGETTTSGSATTTAPPTTTAAPTTTTAAPTTTTTSPPTTTTAAPPQALFSDGTHAVGEDVQPGVYETGLLDPVDDPEARCTWGRLSADNVTVETIVDVHGIVEVLEDDITLTTENCGDWFALAAPPEPLDEMPQGAWAVGVHVDAGRWEAPGGEDCSWARLSAFTGDADAIVDEGTSTGAVIVDVEDDDVGFLSSGCGAWTG